jgi:hypothetical protein
VSLLGSGFEPPVIVTARDRQVGGRYTVEWSEREGSIGIIDRGIGEGAGDACSFMPTNARLAKELAGVARRPVPGCLLVPSPTGLPSQEGVAGPEPVA